ncbi:MAG: hypothetical protein ACTTJ7_00155 [Treponema sp.]
MKKYAIILALCYTLGVSSCLVVKEDTPYTMQLRYEDVQTFTVVGEDVSLLQALNKAKIAAIRQGVIELIGDYAEQSHYAQLQVLLYDTDSPNRYVVNSDIVVLQKSKRGDVYVWKAVIPVKMQELVILLRSKKILVGSYERATPSERTVDRQPQTIDEAAHITIEVNPQRSRHSAEPRYSDEPQEMLADVVASADKKSRSAFLSNYIQNMTYMVFNAENSRADRFLLKTAVDIANGYLIKHGYRMIDAKEVEKIKKDATLIYQENAAEGLSLIQFIAQKLNADVYMELDAVTEGGAELDGYYGSAKITLNIFNPSTGELLGSVPYTSPKTFSKVSVYDAQANAIQSTVYKALPLAIDQAKVLLAKAYAGGIRYEVTINNSFDSKAMARFRNELKNHVLDLKTLHQSAAQTKYAVFLFGTVEDMETIVFNAAETVPGFDRFDLVMLRGKSLTFKTGL